MRHDLRHAVDLADGRNAINMDRLEPDGWYDLRESISGIGV